MFSFNAELENAKARQSALLAEARRESQLREAKPARPRFGLAAVLPRLVPSPRPRRA